MPFVETEEARVVCFIRFARQLIITDFFEQCSCLNDGAEKSCSSNKVWLRHYGPPSEMMTGRNASCRFWSERPLALAKAELYDRNRSCRKPKPPPAKNRRNESFSSTRCHTSFGRSTPH